MENKIRYPCFKCKKKSHFKYRRNMYICVDCFDFYVMKKKFRQNIRNQVDIIGKKNEIVAFLDGTLQSVCMLKLFAENLEKNAPKLEKSILYTIP